LFVDRGYRTLLGTAFYDRLWEIGRLEGLLGAVRTVVVYGPRNVGKSELVRYFLARRLRGRAGRVVAVDARRRRAEHLTGGREGGLARALGEAPFSAAELPRGLGGLLEGLARRLRPPLIVFADEFHLLFPGPAEALAELEAAAGLLAKRGEEQARLIVTVSEGFFATSRALARLHGYSAEAMLVEPMEPSVFQALYEEYRGLRGCSLSLEALTRLAGTSPGYLVDLCPRSGWLLEEWVLAELQRLDAALAEAAAAQGLDVDTARRLAARLLRGEPARAPRERMLGEKLVEANIAYPCPPPLHGTYLPQLPLYLAALEHQQEDPQRLAERLARGEAETPPPRRCRSPHPPRTRDPHRRDKPQP